MSTAGAQEPPTQSSSPLVRLMPRNDSSNSRFIRSCKPTRSRKGSQRTIAILFPPYLKTRPLWGRALNQFCLPSVLHRVLCVHHVALGLVVPRRRRRSLSSGTAGGLLVERLRDFVAEPAVELQRSP